MIVKDYILKNCMPVGECTCVSEAYTYVLTSKQVLKSLYELWAGSATAWTCSEPVSVLRYPFHNKGDFILLGACSSLQGLFTKGLQNAAKRHEFSHFHSVLLLLSVLHRQEKRNKSIKKTKTPVLSLVIGRTAKSEVSQFKFHWWN